MSRSSFFNHRKFLLARSPINVLLLICPIPVLMELETASGFEPSVEVLPTHHLSHVNSAFTSKPRLAWRRYLPFATTENTFGIRTLHVWRDKYWRGNPEIIGVGTGKRRPQALDSRYSLTADIKPEHCTNDVGECTILETNEPDHSAKPPGKHRRGNSSTPDYWILLIQKVGFDHEPN